MQGTEVAVIGGQLEHARATVAVERFENDIAVLFLKRADRAEITRDGGRRRQVGKPEHQQFFGIVADPEWIIHHQRCL